MNRLHKKYLTNYIKFYELIISIILILDQVSSAVPIGDYKDMENFHLVCYTAPHFLKQTLTAQAFTADNINPSLCTHIIYVSAFITSEATIVDENDEIKLGGYAKFTGLKNQNKDLKVMLNVDKSFLFGYMVANAEKRQQLVNNSITFLRQNNFDGFDFLWSISYIEESTDNYYTFLQELREGFERESIETGRPRLLLTMLLMQLVRDNKWDIPNTQYIDWLNIFPVNSYDKLKVNHYSPLYGLNGSLTSPLDVNSTINHIVQSGTVREKIVLGIAPFGTALKLKNPAMTAIGSEAVGDLPGEHPSENGILAYYQICKNIKDDGWIVVRPYPNAMGPYAYKGNQWVSYDDENIVKTKAEYVATNKLRGLMFFLMEQDDFQGYCTGKQFPLIQAAKEALINA